ncbi:MAG: cobyrinate a,c-diamide synthase [bacterium]
MRSAFYLTATKKSSGKTTVSIALARALHKRQKTVQVYKKGPDYIDPLWLSAAANNPCYNLDFNVQNAREIIDLYQNKSQQADVVFVEGNKGLFDGVDPEGHDSNAALAKLIQLPVILVLDCQGMTRGIAPILQGYENFDDEVHFAGVILNNIAGPRHQEKLIAAVERYTTLEILGCIPYRKDVQIEERHLGLIPNPESDHSEQKIDCLAGFIEQHLDIDRLLAITQSNKPELDNSNIGRISKPNTYSLTIGVARDSAFCFYYEDDLEEFIRLGCKIIYFSPLKDTKIPNVDALFLGGGFPETHAEQLQNNQLMKDSIQQFCNNGGIVYAECGGLIYLSKSMYWEQSSYDMAGIFEQDIAFTAKPNGRGLARLEGLTDHPWDLAGTKVSAHEFHYSHVIDVDKSTKFAYRVIRGAGVTKGADGLVKNNVLAAYVHLRNTQSVPWINWFLKFVEKVKNDSTK